MLGCCAYEIISVPLPPTLPRGCFWPASAFLAAICRRHCHRRCSAALYGHVLRETRSKFFSARYQAIHGPPPQPAPPTPAPPLASGTCHKLANQATRRFVLSLSLSLPLLPTRLIAVQLTYNLDIAFDLPSPYGAREMVAHSLHTLHLPLASCRVATRCLSLLLRSLLLLPLRVVFAALPIDQWQLQTVPPNPLLSYSLLIFVEQCQRQGLLYGTRYCRRGYSRVAPSYSSANYPLAPTLHISNELQPLQPYV